MIHGMIEGRLCHYITKSGVHKAGLMVGVNRESNASKASVFVPPRSIAELSDTVKSVVSEGDTIVAALTKVLASFIVEDVPFMPAAKNIPDTWHWSERAE